MPGPRGAGRLDIADVVRAHRAALESVHPLSRAQKRVLTDIVQCRTAVLGGHLDRCLDCGHEKPSYNSCRNRHCPKCQALAQEKWIAAQRARMLDVGHFHVVFTMPAELRALAAWAPRAVFDALFRAASRTLLEFGQRRLSVLIGATLVLHTWTRALQLHPHVHAIVTAGGLSLDGLRWKRSRRAFLFPVKAMGRVLRGKMLDELKTAYQQGAFAGFEDFFDPEGFDRLRRALATRPSWHVYAKPAFSKGEHVLQYLGRYTHRVGISNSRLLEVTDQLVRFKTKGDGVESVTPVEFLRRFVQHVLPDGFHKLRHIGLYASTDKRERARGLLGTQAAAPSPPTRSSCELLFEITGHDVARCPLCNGPVVSLPLPRCRDPPELAAA